MSNAQKTPLTLGLNRLATQRAIDQIALLGKALPGKVVAVSGAIVTVSFSVDGVTLPQVTMPLFGPTYIRYPIQVGDLGVAFPIDVYLGGISGLGGGTADASTPGNLSALVWFPVGNANWAPTQDPNSVVVNGPNGVILENASQTSTLTLKPTTINVTAQNSLTLQAAGHVILINGLGIFLDGKQFLTHEHSGVTIGGSPTGGVV